MVKSKLTTRKIHQRRLLAALITAAFFAFVPAASIAQQLPNSAAARQFSAWLDAFNSGRQQALMGFNREHFATLAPIEERQVRLRGWMQARQMAGGFDVVRSDNFSDAKLTVLLKGRDDDSYWQASVEVEPAAPNLVTAFDLKPVARPAGVPGVHRLTESEAISALRAELEKESAADKFSGAVMIAKNGRSIFEAAYGDADREKKIPNRVDTIFRIGSMNKMFTAVATLQLVQAGKINLNETIGKYLPDYPNKDVASKVTIHELLTHTGGTGDFFGPEYQAHRKELRELKDYIALFGNRGLNFEPDTKWQYSNYGFIILGRIIEAVSGESYYNYVRTHIFKPAGMKSTDSYPEDQNVPGRSVGYTRMGPPSANPVAGSNPNRPATQMGRATLTEGPLHSNEESLPYRGTSAGGGYSTVGDLIRFANALTGHKLLNAEYSALATTGKVETGRPGGGKYAYGFSDITSEDGVREIGHGGGAPGMNGELMIFPESEYSVAVLANLDPPAATRIAQLISRRLPAK